MSYTSVDLVRNHLNTSFPIQSVVSDQPVILKGEDYAVFFGGSIDTISLAVKAVRSNDLTRKTFTLSGGGDFVSAVPIIPSSVLVASDSSLGTVYVEGKDYLIDCSAGLLTLVDGGALVIGQAVTVWYQAYFVFTSVADYVVEGSRGAIKRASSGAIAEGETVYLDYTPVFVSYQEALLTGAVAEANALVEKAVDPNRQFGADAVLQGAATYRALEIVCRASAVRELAGQGRSDKAALAWIKLADNYADRSEQLLNCFRPPVSGPSAPVKS